VGNKENTQKKPYTTNLKEKKKLVNLKAYNWNWNLVILRRSGLYSNLGSSFKPKT